MKLLAMFLLSVLSCFAQDLTPRVVPAGVPVKSDSTMFILNRAQIDSIAVHLKELKLTRVENLLLEKKAELYQLGNTQRDTLLSYKDMRIQLLNETINDYKAIISLQEKPWYDHWYVGVVGTLAAIWGSVKVLEVTK